MSAIWKYFTLETTTSSTAICNLCKIKVSRGGSSVAVYNTTNLIKHLKNHHTEEHEEFRQAKQKKDEESKKQLTLPEAYSRHEKLPNNSPKAAKITEKVLEFIVLDDQPLSVVDNVGFRRLMEYLEPRYSLPSQKYISETALPEQYSRVMTLIEEQVKDAQSMSFTADIWSSAVCPMSLLSVTVHWVNPQSYDFQNVVLQVKGLCGSQTSTSISTVIREMLGKWNISLKKVHTIVRDNASNMKKAMDDLGIASLGCFAQSLQFVIHEGLLSQRSVSDAVASARKIVGHFKHSPLACTLLEDIQTELQMTQKRLKQDVQTRWNSTHQMIASLLEQKRALCAYAADHNLPVKLTANQWALLEKTMNILALFAELTRNISSSTSTTADVIPAISVLERLLSRQDDSDTGIKSMKTTLLQAVNRRFGEVQDEPLYSIATLLDPRYKDRYFTRKDTAKSAKDALAREVEKMEEILQRTSTIVGEPAAKLLCLEAARPSTSTSQCSLSSLFEEILEEHEDPTAGRSITSTSSQIQTYLAEQTIPRSDSPFQYWRINQHRFPALAATAVKFLCAPSTSVESERLFSTVSNVIGERSRRLTADKAEMLFFLKKNLPLVLK
ncbi:zinc finger BED domain-containing protein 4-like isoform X1 [Paramormyrops kingsleyae]|uniref:zinc finger BED domain-containing protein 4-like isoform X1 n=1 Tax=Paramormyrops kingsleyae TaxID=1676925 RepID=UPI003B97CED8